MSNGYRKYTAADKQKMAELAMEGKLLREIAEQMGSSTGYVSSALHNLGISVMEIKKARKEKTIADGISAAVAAEIADETTPTGEISVSDLDYTEYCQYKRWPGNSKYPLYVSRDGNIWSPTRGEHPNNDTATHYLQTAITMRDGERCYCYVHRIVWETYCGSIPEGMTINHKDLNKRNNCLSNLELLSHRDNILHARSLKKWAANNATCVKNIKSGESWRFPSRTAAANFLHTTISTVTRAIQRDSLVKRTFRITDN